MKISITPKPTRTEIVIDNEKLEAMLLEAGELNLDLTYNELKALHLRFWHHHKDKKLKWRAIKVGDRQLGYNVKVLNEPPKRRGG